MTPRLRKGLQNLSTDPDVQKVVIVGCGRSGTYYMREVMKRFGLHVGHEAMGRNGISSWYEVSDQRSKDIREYFQGHKCYYLHVVRNPFDVIASLWRCEEIPEKHGLKFFRINCPEYNDLKGIDYIAKHWIVWNKKAEENFDIDFTFQVETIGTPIMVAFLLRLFKDSYSLDDIELYTKRIQRVKANTHSKIKEEARKLKSRNLSLICREEIIDRLDPVIYYELKETAKRYGYWSK